MKSMELIATPISAPTRDSVRRIQNADIRRQFKNMNDLRVVWLVVSHLSYKRRVGLLSFGCLVLSGYIVWDKLVRLFV